MKHASHYNYIIAFLSLIAVLTSPVFGQKSPKEYSDSLHAVQLIKIRDLETKSQSDSIRFIAQLEAQEKRFEELHYNYQAVNGEYQHVSEFVKVATYAYGFLGLLITLSSMWQWKRAREDERELRNGINEMTNLKFDVAERVNNEIVSREKAIINVQQKTMEIVDDKFREINVEGIFSKINEDIKQMDNSVREAINRLALNIDRQARITDSRFQVLNDSLKTLFEKEGKSALFQEMTNELEEVKVNFNRPEYVRADLFSGNDRQIRSAMMKLFVNGTVDDIPSLSALALISPSEELQKNAQETIDEINRRMSRNRLPN